MAQGGSYRDGDYYKWQRILGERAIKIRDYSKIPEIIVSILETYAGKDKDSIINSWDGSTAIAVADALSGLSVNKVSKDNDLIEFYSSSNNSFSVQNSSNVFPTSRAALSPNCIKP